jgi:hypothetical protein
VPSKKASVFRKPAPSGVNEAYASDVSGNISSAIKLTSTVTWITSIGPGKTWMGETRIRLASFQFPCVQAARNFIRRIGVARTSQVLRQGSNGAMRFSSFTASYAYSTLVVGCANADGLEERTLSRVLLQP